MAEDKFKKQAVQITIPDDRIGQAFSAYFSPEDAEPQNTDQTISYEFEEYSADSAVSPASINMTRDTSSVPAQESMAHSREVDNDTHAKKIRDKVDNQAEIMNDEPDVRNNLLGDLDVSYLLNSDSTGDAVLPDNFPPAPLAEVKK